MKQIHLPLFITTAAAVIMVIFKNHLIINNPDDAMGSLLITYTVSWLLILMLQKPFKQSWLAMQNLYQFCLSFIKAY